ncbi:PhzF family phenazine biosynthesis protein [Leifsonia sp. NPDC056665]|uniref:PhzF family phenazine biosynthesis protein n=1 Tax=Leifsonia sp. NPDC056665 TaxID=3345901 RepID=UPI0036921577
MRALGLTRADLDPYLPPALIRVGNPYPVLRVTADALERLDHDADEVLRSQDQGGWDGTVPVVHRVSRALFGSRSPFSRGAIREDPATGSAAADLGAYRRWGGHIATPATVAIKQGGDGGGPASSASVSRRRGGVRVSGTVARFDSD